MTTFKTKTMHNLSKEDLLSSEEVTTREDVTVRTIVLIPLDKKHESGYPCIAVIGCNWSDMIKGVVTCKILGKVSDIVDLHPSLRSYRIDFLKRSGCACISNGDLMKISLPLGSDAHVHGKEQ